MYKLTEKQRTREMLKNIDSTNNICPVCRKEITGVEICGDEILCNKTQRGTYVYFHKKCYKNAWQ